MSNPLLSLDIDYPLIQAPDGGRRVSTPRWLPR